METLSKRVREGEIFITSTDKSSRFALLNRKQYLDSGKVHASKDKQIKWCDVKYLQAQVNSHMWWLSRIVDYSKDTDPRRMSKNIQGFTVEVPEMVLLIKDHKVWSPTSGDPVPSRPVVSGSRGINTHLSEWISEFLEPIAAVMGSGEISSTEEALARIDSINNDIKANVDTPHYDVLDSLAERDKTVINTNEAVFNFTGCHTMYNSAPDMAPKRYRQV